MNVIPGLEILLGDRLDLLRGKRIGILCNPTSVDRRLHHIVDLLGEHPEITVTTLMGPQHGARGETQDNMIESQDYRDPVTDLPVYSLYSDTRKPTAEMLDEIDALVIDLQDVGARIYTYVYTMVLAMEACRAADVEVIVLDRPNPINGVDVEGPVLEPAFSSFIGLYPLPIRHGLTIGELARYFNQEMGIGCRLQVVPMSGWQRHMFFPDTGLPWVIPSPNLPTQDTALVYPGMVLFEGTNSFRRKREHSSLRNQRCPLGAARASTALSCRIWPGTQPHFVRFSPCRPFTNGRDAWWVASRFT